MPHVYKIVFSNGDIYVGSTTQPVKRRISNHVSSLRHNNNPVRSLIEPFKKHGWRKVDGCQTFNATIISIPVDAETKKELRQHEQQHMDAIDHQSLLNIRRTNNEAIEDHDFITTPVDCSAWLALLYPETDTIELTKAA